MKQIVTSITLSCFLLSFVFGETLKASVISIPLTNHYNELTGSSIIPLSAGRVTEAWIPGPAERGALPSLSDKRNIVVVNIQDLHCHAEVQKNISRILKSLEEKYALKNVYVEGAAGEVDTSWLRGIKDGALKSSVT